MPAARGAGRTANGEMGHPQAATSFLEREASALSEALAQPECRRSAIRAMRRQDGAHEAWLALVRRARQHGDSALADTITALYGFHGRVAGRLERGFHPGLGPVVERRVRLLLLTELHKLTAQAVRGLAAHDSTGPTRPRGARSSVVPCGSRRRGGSLRR